MTVILEGTTSFPGMYGTRQQVFTANYPVHSSITGTFGNEACRIQNEGFTA